MSDDGATVVSDIRNRYLKILYSYVLSKYSTEYSTDEDEDEQDVYAAIRVGTIITLLSPIMVCL